MMDAKVLTQKNWKDRVTITKIEKIGRTFWWKIRKSILDTLYWRGILDITLGSGVDIRVWSSGKGLCWRFKFGSHQHGVDI